MKALTLLLVFPLINTLISTFPYSTHSLPSQISPQLIALLSLKSSLNDPLNTTFLDWHESTGPTWCSWTAVECHLNTTRIASLDFSGRNLSGQIPPQIRLLSALTYLNLSRNAFSGTLSPAVFSLPELRVLDLSRNFFNSTFPPGASRLRSLRVLNAYSNSFVGPLPTELVGLPFLEELNLGGSYFEGSIPSEYGGFRRLRTLYLAGNLLGGDIPIWLGQLSELERMEIGYNSFTGGIPAELGMLSRLSYLDLSNANLSGEIPPELGKLTRLETLLLFKNRLSGEIPNVLGRLSALKVLDLSDNQISGAIPAELSNLKELSFLDLMENSLAGEIPEGIGELPNLEMLLLWNNSLTGVIPQGLGSSGKLFKVDLSTNALTGPIPPNICNGTKLEKLMLFSNRLNGSFPSSLAGCTSLTRLRVQNNQLSGALPRGLGLWPGLIFVDLSSNRFVGPVPEDLGSSASIGYVNISQNPVNGTLPENIWNGTSLKIFSAGSCGLVGRIPDFVGCKSAYNIELQENWLAGNIPWDIGHCEKLISLNLSRNSLAGIIPWEISTLPTINVVDLSHNLLSGTIPSNFANTSTLETFDVAFNNLTGPVPDGGVVFSNLRPSSFAGNDGLCGEVLGRPCASSSAATADDLSAAGDGQRGGQKRTAGGAVVWVMAVAFGVGLFVLAAGTRCFRGGGRGGARFEEESKRRAGPWKLTAFQRVNFTAEDVVECLSTSEKVLGMGATGTVYKAEMPGGEVVAVKKLWGRQKEAAAVGRRRGGVLAEVEVLGSVRHRNIVRLLGCCSNKECTMLLYEYMPNGSLDDLLHGKDKGHNLGADWVVKYKIALGVAQGICYLHHDCDPVIVHRDLKPSNILLDSEMEARVADFGVAKLIHTDESMSVIAGSYGYIAPEYAYTLQVDEKSDIYSYGVVLMELVSGRRSVEAEFGDGNSIVDWIRAKIKSKEGTMQVLNNNSHNSSSSSEEMMQMLRIALLCTCRNPADRPSMRDVVLMLQEAKPKRKTLPYSHTIAAAPPPTTATTTATTPHVMIGIDGDSSIINISGSGDNIPLPLKLPSVAC